MLVVVCEEIETIKKIKKIWYYNEFELGLYNLMWVFLKSGYVNKKKKKFFC